MIDLLPNWNLEKVNIISLQSNIMKVTSGGNTFYLKKRNGTSSTERLEEYLITQYLVRKGFPVETPLLTNKGEVFINSDESFYSLYASLDGTSFYNSSFVTSQHSFSLGVYLARFHQALERYPYKKETAVWNVYGYLKSWLSVPNPELNEWGKRVYAGIAQHERLYEQLPPQLVHSDLHLRNFLWQGQDISGLVDFERIRIAPRVADIAYLITSILRDTGRQSDPTHSLKKIHQILKGYTKNKKLRKREILSIPPLVILFFLQYTLFYSQRGHMKEVEYHVNKVDFMISDTRYLESLTDF
ncbi:phosphotransferase enzyme family protein [Bacillus sp. Marseille-Q1617]|uniref:phosphotransferase enzyme family protein n=1 Tax=Bacillus sp. Marseille-Q1617 TaxID=2736887 RepID=UPI00158BF859|nr:phosphotransferase [Bacillus sp. Marseille-Q1617]